mgnify:CR=1 FL=1|jgi:hypothetical protein
MNALEAFEALRHKSRVIMERHDCEIHLRVFSPDQGVIGKMKWRRGSGGERGMKAHGTVSVPGFEEMRIEEEVYESYMTIIRDRTKERMKQRAQAEVELVKMMLA